MKRTFKRVCIITVSILCVLILAIGIYAGDYYHADGTAKSAMKEATLEKGYAVFEGGDTGFIFYPGGKVEYSAYAPLMKQLADKGITCVLAKMPLNLAVLDANAWKSIVDEVDGVDTWYIGGHSLGGAMASVATENGTFEGLILLAAYATDKISIPTLSIYGNLDGVMNREKYEDSLAMMPKEFTEIILDGGNHAGFGSYGVQDGDNIADISNEAQIELTADAIIKFIMDN